MKNENFNINLKTLDDQAMYQEICQKIRESEGIRFKLLWIVPLVSCVLVLILWLEILRLPAALVVITGLFGSAVTYFIFRWEKRHIQFSIAFRKQAALLESRKNEQENLNALSGDEGPYSMIDKLVKPGLFEKPDLVLRADEPNGTHKHDQELPVASSSNSGGWGKTEAEMAVYLATILLWLFTAVTGLLKEFLQNSFLGYLIIFNSLI